MRPTATASTATTLGLHARNRGAGYIDLDLRPAKRRWNLSAGAREEVFSGGAQAVFAPQLSGSLRLTSQLKLRSSAGYGFRIPTYTDLYYSDPTTIGNPNLKPESAWSGDAGADWAPSTRLSLSVTGFYSRQHDAIDYVRANSTQKWQAVNLSGLHFAGVESTLTWAPPRSQSVSISWTGSLRRAERPQWPSVRVCLQLSCPEHSCRLDHSPRPRLRHQQHGAACSALSAIRLPRMERRPHP